MTGIQLYCTIGAFRASGSPPDTQMTQQAERLCVRAVCTLAKPGSATSCDVDVVFLTGDPVRGPSSLSPVRYDIYRPHTQWVVQI